MMIIHIALFRWKQGTPQEKIDLAIQKVKQLKDKCSGIIDIFCGLNFHKEAKGFTHGVVVLAKDQQALDTYRLHPDHKIVAKDIAEIEEEGLGFDFKE